MAITVTYADFIVFGLPERTLTGHPNNSVDSATVNRYQAAAALRVAACLEESGRRVVDEANPTEEIRMRIAQLSAWPILSNLIGFNPENDADQAIRRTFEDAEAWLAKVCDGMTVVGTEDIDGGEVGSLAVIATEQARGW